MLLDLLLALGLLMSMSSQLRFSEESFGPGEVVLAIWIIWMLSREVGRLGPPLSEALSRLLSFWIVFALAMCLGTMTGFAIGDRHDPVWFQHDIIAYAVVAAVSCLSVVEPGAASRVHRVAWLLATLGAIWLVIQVAGGWKLIEIGGFDSWEWDRFRGLSENANQLALGCAVLGLLCLHLAEMAVRPGERIAALVCMIVPIIVGRLTKSDAFLLVLVVASPLFIALKFGRSLMLAEGKVTLRSAMAWILAIALPLIAAYVIPFAASVNISSDQVLLGMTRAGASADTEDAARLRVHLWNEAVRRGIESGMLGLGPGPHLEIPSAIVVGRRGEASPDLFHPELNNTPNFEAHNTMLDLFVQGGVIAAASLGWLAASAVLATHRAKLDALTALLCGLALYSFFHLIVRHPIVWFAIALCLTAATNALRTSPTRLGS
jgi:O-Antigen ligase